MTLVTVGRQAVVPGSVLSTGRLGSIRTVSTRQPESLPSWSTMRVSKVFAPVSEITTLAGAGPANAMPFTCHSAVRGPPSTSSPDTSTV